MKEFEVTITETLQKSVVVEADSKDDAIQMVEDMWKDADIILDSENFVGVEYEADNGKEIEKTNELEVLLVEPGQYAKMTTIEAGLSSMQNIVGGNIQAAYFFEEPVAIVCNEEGKLKGLPVNFIFVRDFIVGDVFFVAAGEEDFEGLNDEQIKNLMLVFGIY